MDKVEKFKNILRAKGERVSSPRLAIFKRLAGTAPLAPTALVELMQREAVDAATTYRTIKLFRDLGVVRDVMAGGQRLIELSDDYEQHHHHFWCVNCGRLMDFDNAAIEQGIARAARDMGVTVRSHQLEINGLCEKCG